MSDIDYIQVLLEDLAAGKVQLDWATQIETKDLRKWKAFRNSDKEYLKAINGTWPADRLYKVDPLPKRISLAYADFLFQKTPVVSPYDEKDREAQRNLLEQSRFGSRLRKGADICVSEGQTWWHIFMDPAQSLWPIIEYRSRADVIPYMVGDTVMAVAFVTKYGGRTEGDPTYRLLEIHAAGEVQNVLYKAADERESTNTATRNNSSINDEGTNANPLGTEVNLSEYPPTANIQPVWKHNLPILAGRTRNGDDAESVYDGLEDFFLDLNEAHVIDAENFALAGKKRATIPKKYADQAGGMDKSKDVIWTDDNDLGESEDPIKILEYDYDAQASIARKDDLANTAITRAGLARQLVDANASEGLAQTGTALRTRLLPTIASVTGMSQEWVDQVPVKLSLMQQVDALNQSSGGGHQWTDPVSLPSVAFQSPLPVDAAEEAQTHQTLVAAELESIETAIDELRPTWGKDRKLLEVRRILANRAGYALDDEGNPVTASTAPNPPDKVGRTQDEPGSEGVPEVQPTGPEVPAGNPPVVPVA